MNYKVMTMSHLITALKGWRGCPVARLRLRTKLGNVGQVEAADEILLDNNKTEDDLNDDGDDSNNGSDDLNDDTTVVPPRLSSSSC